MNPTDRMPPIPAADMTVAQRDAANDYKQVRNTTVFEGPFVPLLRSPELLSKVQRVGEYLRYRSALPRHLSELVILISARHWCQQFEWGVHSAEAEKAGLAPLVIEAVADGRRPTGMTNEESTLHDFCAELLRNQRVSDVTYGRATDLFGEQGIVDTVGLLGYYSLLAMMMNTARTPMREGMRPGLERFPV